MIIVTAGHVDHGKTALLQALTGTNTAHLPEEKKRGLTIDLGYAYLPIENDVIGFIDVPGHQKFLANMLAGLGGVRYALLVVSAEEGIKPQTEEHLTLLKLLHFEKIMVVITKVDKVLEKQILDLINEIKIKFEFLAVMPFFITSSKTNFGIEELKNYLIALNSQDSQINKPFRYAIDRVFNLKGSGLVVTGTAIAGKIKVGDEFYLSANKKVRVKGIHAQNQPSEIGLAGQRLALNIANVEKEEIKRGDWICELKPLFPTERITVNLFNQQALKENTVVHLYHFARHITGKLNLLSDKQAGRFSESFAEIILDEPLHIALNDKLIIRSGDDSQTLASGVVLEIDSPKRHKRSEQRLAYLNELKLAENELTRFNLYLKNQAWLIDKLTWVEQRFIEEIKHYPFYFIQDFIFSDELKNRLQQYVIDAINQYHEQHTDQLGVAKARLYRMALLKYPESLAYLLIDDLIEQNKLAQTRGWIHSVSHKFEFSESEKILWQVVLPLFQATTQALWVRDIALELSVDEKIMRDFLYKAGKLGYLIPIVKDRFLLNEQIVKFAALIKNYIEQHGSISVNQLRDEIQYGRKLTVQLIEYFDRSGFLRRKGNEHLLRDQDIYF